MRRSERRKRLKAHRLAESNRATGAFWWWIKQPSIDTEADIAMEDFVARHWGWSPYMSRLSKRHTPAR